MLPLCCTCCDFCFVMLLQPVLQEVSHRVCCGLFKEYHTQWQQQQQQQQQQRKQLDLEAMSPYFLERSQVQQPFHPSPSPPPPPPSLSLPLPRACRWRLFFRAWSRSCRRRMQRCAGSRCIACGALMWAAAALCVVF